MKQAGYQVVSKSACWILLDKTNSDLLDNRSTITLSSNPYNLF